MVTVHPGFLADIIDHPDDDVPRLIYADWLEEQGEEVRAEFIRVQCELAKTPLTISVAERPDQYGGFSFYDEPNPRYEALRRRERELLDAFSGKRDGEKSFSNRAWWSIQAIGFAFSHHPWEHCGFRRGFVDRVKLTREQWCGVECSDCPDRKGWQHLPYPGGWELCDNCHGTGRTGGHGPAVVKAAPIERVMLTDVSPRPVDGERRRFLWLEQDLPRCLFDMLPLDDCPFLTATNWKRFPSKQAALDALSHACLVWAKSAK